MQLAETNLNLPSLKTRILLTPQNLELKASPFQFFMRIFKAYQTAFPRFFQGFSQFFRFVSPLRTVRFNPFSGDIQGWDPFSETERLNCHGAKLNRGEVLHVPRNAWFTLRALRRGWNLGEPLGVSGWSVWELDVGEGELELRV